MSSKGLRKRYIGLGVIVAIILSYWLFADSIIKSILESKLSDAYGAQVDIGEFDHSLFPVEVEMHNIAMTDAVRPEHNKVVVGTAKADVEVMPLLSNQVIVNNLHLLDVAFDQPRATPGEVYRQPESSFSFDELAAQAKEAVPSVDELLARSPLKTTAAVNQAQEAYSQYSDSLQADYDALPDKARIEQYKADIEKLKNTNYKDPQALLAAKEQLDALKTQIKADKALISNFTDNAKDARKALSASVEALKTAPQEDYALLQGVIAGDAGALEQVTQLVFGDKAAQYSEYLMSAIQIVLPMLQGGDETPVEETSGDMPSLLIRNTQVSVKWQQESITSQWKNITNNHPLIGDPTTFTIEAAGNMLKNFTSSGQFWIDDNGVDADQKWDLSGLNLKDIPFSDNENLKAVLTSALMATHGSFSVKDNALSGTGKVLLDALKMQAEGDNKYTSAVASALDSLSSLDLTMLLDGTVNKPGFHISSDLDNQLGKLALTQLSASQQDKLAELKSKLQAKVGDQQALNSSKLGDIASMLSGAEGDSNSLEALLNTQLSSVVEQEKNKLFDKLKSKLGKGN